jgi:Effector-associated domain 11
VTLVPNLESHVRTLAEQDDLSGALDALRAAARRPAHQDECTAQRNRIVRLERQVRGHGITAEGASIERTALVHALLALAREIQAVEGLEQYQPVEGAAHDHDHGPLEIALANLLQSLCGDAPQLRRLLGTTASSPGLWVPDWISPDAAIARAAAEAAGLLVRQRLATPQFFVTLVEAIPGRAHDIQVVAAQFAR